MIIGEIWELATGDDIGELINGEGREYDGDGGI